ncbi:MAG: alpha-2-macroglobulin family protein, partial [Actinomycetota bacterium]|nr:alpha-2-macroglobulin family protein [Actinomycetota bacterium]
EYLRNFPYGCTEQLVSQGVPAMVMARRPEFGVSASEASLSFTKVLDMLRGRQNEEGGFGYWAANHHVDPFISVYANHFLIDAKERGFGVPGEVVSLGNRYLQQLAGSEGATLDEERVRAYAIYLLTRQGVVTSGYAQSLDRRLRANHAQTWRTDITGAFLAATYQLLRQEGPANELIAASQFGRPQTARYGHYDDALTNDALRLYLISRHFPARLEGVRARAIDAIVGPIGQGAYNTLSSAYAILALDAYVTAAAPVATGRFTLTETLSNGTARELALPGGTFPTADVTAGARSVAFASASDIPAFYQLIQSGFDRTIPTEPLSEGIEVFREYTDRSGKAVTEVTVGDELQVRLRFRALRGGGIANVALMDLLPGGFEVVVDRTPAVVERAEPASDGGDEYSEEGGEEYVEEGDCCDVAWTPSFGQAIGNWAPDYAEVREDRVVVYGTAESTAREYVYTVKATAVGSFAIPPVLGEGMYDRGVRAWSRPGRIVVRPAR